MLLSNSTGHQKWQLFYRFHRLRSGVPSPLPPWVKRTNHEGLVKWLWCTRHIYRRPKVTNTGNLRFSSCQANHVLLLWPFRAMFILETIQFLRKKKVQRGQCRCLFWCFSCRYRILAAHWIRWSLMRNSRVVGFQGPVAQCRFYPLESVCIKNKNN